MGEFDYFFQWGNLTIFSHEGNLIILFNSGNLTIFSHMTMFSNVGAKVFRMDENLTISPHGREFDHFKWGESDYFWGGEFDYFFAWGRICLLFSKMKRIYTIFRNGREFDYFSHGKFHYYFARGELDNFWLERIWLCFVRRINFHAKGNCVFPGILTSKTVRL